MKKQKKKYYPSCEFLPLWNFFKLNNGDPQSLKYLLVLDNRLDYNDAVLTPKQMEVAEALWADIFKEYDKLEKNFGAVNFLGDKSKILYNYAMYLQEESMLKSLLYRTNVVHLAFLRGRGYVFNTKTQENYWTSLRDALHKVKNHLSYIQILRNKITDVAQDSKKEGNPFDAIMAWILTNDIRVDDTLTVSRYIEIKRIIQNKTKAKQKEQRSKAYG